jgi:hypothetical protein
LGAFLALRLSGGLHRRGYLLLARHLGFSPVSRRGLSGRWHDELLMSRAVMALSTIGGALARIKGRKQCNLWPLRGPPSRALRPMFDVPSPSADNCPPSARKGRDSSCELATLGRENVDDCVERRRDDDAGSGGT